VQLRWLQPFGLYVANSIFVGDYLTTKGQLPEADFAMIRDLGFTVLGHESEGLEEASEPWLTGGLGGGAGSLTRHPNA
jgi:biotin synthase-like enzyme